MDVTVVIPYFGGTSSAANSDRGNREKYLRRTFCSVYDFASEIIVGVCNDEDEKTVGRQAVRIVCDPINLASVLCRYAQQVVKTSLVYVTEADQELYYQNRGIFDIVRDDIYLIPHRLEEIVRHPSGLIVGSDRGYLVEFDGELYVLPNGAPEKAWGAIDFYEPAKMFDAFGGAYLCSAELFRKVDFSPDEQWPVESATGFRISKVGRALKTGMWDGFFVEHLSGVEYHRSLIEGSAEKVAS